MKRILFGATRDLACLTLFPARERIAHDVRIIECNNPIGTYTPGTLPDTQTITTMWTP